MKRKNINYLRALGIDRWTLRQDTDLVLPACYAYELWHQGHRVGVLFAAAVAENAAITILLEKIIAAIQCEPRGHWYSMQPDYAELGTLRFIITLGDGFEVPDSVAHLHSYAPQHLIDTPKLKAETWQTLQAIFDYL